MKKKNSIVAIIPIKKKSKRVKGKNFRLINKRPLYKYLLAKLKRCNFSKIYVDTDSQEIKNYCQKMNYNVIDRISSLATNEANGNDLLNYHGKIIKADFYFQLFITSPLLKIKTINDCIKVLVNERKHDSILTVKKIYTWFWFNNKPVNYKPKVLPRSQDAKPIIMESTGLYGITKKSLKKNKCRIGNNPFFFEISEEESIDLDNEKDFKYLEFYVKKHLSRTNGRRT